MKIKRYVIEACLLGAVLLSALAGKAQPTVSAIAAGGGFSLFLKTDGSLWGMGFNGNGELGDGTYNNTAIPEQIVSGGVTAIAAGGGHSLFLKSNGSLWAMGANYAGQLGTGTYNSTAIPEQIVSSAVITISAGEYHSLFKKRPAKTQTQLYTVGDNGDGQLGDGTFNTTNLPVRIENYVSPNPDGSPVTLIAGGGFHSLFLKGDSSLWAMGANVNGELGDSTFNSTATPEQIVPDGVIRIAAGDSHSLFVESDGSLWAMGWNLFGQLGDGTFNNVNVPEMIVASNVTAVSAGYDHSLFLKSDGSLWAMGGDEYGQLGDRNYNATGLPVPELILTGPPPAMGITTYSNQPVLLFPLVGTNYVLKTTTNLVSGVWTTVSNGVPFVGVQIPNAPVNAFFKLQ